MVFKQFSMLLKEREREIQHILDNIFKDERQTWTFKHPRIKILNEFLCCFFVL